MDEKIKKSRERLNFFRGFLTAFGIVAVIYFLSIYLPIGGYPQKPGTLQALRKSREIERVIQNHYLNEIDEQKQTEYMYIGQVAGLDDEYSTYYTAEEYATVQRNQSGSFMGMGISIAQEDDRIVITECQEDYPAALAGILPEDVILEVNGSEVTGMSSSEVASLIQSAPDGVVQMLIDRDGEEESLEFEVELTELESIYVSGEMLDSSVGYIRIAHFTGVTSAQFKNAYGELQLQGMEKLIIDLRDNTGGLVSSVCDTLSQILPSGVIVYTEDKYGNRTEKNSEGASKITIPLVVLVNENTASASEIFAGAVQDYEIGTIAGVTTFGKGIVQDTFRLSDGSYLKLTVAKYYTPNGSDIHEIGITPDVEIEMEEDAEKDVQLEKARKLIDEME